MLNTSKKELLVLLALAYIGFAQWASTWWSQLPLCILISDYQPTYNHTENQSCATFFEGVVRFLRFLWESADHDNVIAFGTIMVAVFTFTLWQSTKRLWEASERQLDAISEEFITSHRPELRLKHIWLASPDGQTVSADFWSRSPLVIRLDIVNRGATTAYINFINFVTLIVPITERLPARPPYDEADTRQTFFDNAPVENGMTFTIPLSDGRNLTPNEVRDIAWKDAKLYFIGTIAYRDAAKKPRQMAFCRYLDFFNVDPDNPPIGSRARFATDTDPDYEYQD
jgi:hypothetical protein